MSGRSRVGDANVGADIAPDDDVVARRERALPTAGADGDRGRLSERSFERSS